MYSCWGLAKIASGGKLMMWYLGWVSGDPDADTFYQILYGVSKGQANHSRFDLPEWNQLYKKAKTMSNSPERDELYREMDKLFFRLCAPAPGPAPHAHVPRPALGDRLPEERLESAALDVPGYRRASSSITAASSSFGGSSPCAMMMSWNSR